MGVFIYDSAQSVKLHWYGDFVLPGIPCSSCNWYHIILLSAFGIGSMVYSGLEFGEYFEMTDRCRSVLSVITPGLRMTLTLAQMQFIFLTNKDIESGSYKMIQRFGFMHMVATNLCEWLYVLVEETKHEIHHLEHTILSSANGTHNETEALPCRRANIMGALLQNASPFLFPCTIEYSLICAVILYEMWKEVRAFFVYSENIIITSFQFLQ